MSCNYFLLVYLTRHRYIFHFFVWQIKVNLYGWLLKQPQPKLSVIPLPVLLGTLRHVAIFCTDMPHIPAAVPTSQVPRSLGWSDFEMGRRASWALHVTLHGKGHCRVGVFPSYCVSDVKCCLSLLKIGPPGQSHPVSKPHHESKYTEPCRHETSNLAKKCLSRQFHEIMG